MIEVYCHGGVSVVRSVYRTLRSAGFREAERGEFTFRAFLNDKTDLTRAEAVNEIIGAKTDEGRSRAVGRLMGTLYDEIDAIKHLILDARGAIEAEFEYPEDENAIADAFDPSVLHDAERRLTLLCASWVSEKLYQEGARVVLCGRPNAGKSSAFNALLKEDRAIVSDVAGTTRDYLESWASFDGVPVRLFDTAGLRDDAGCDTECVERVGIERARELIDDADCVLYLIDAALGVMPEDADFIKKQKAKSTVIPVFNKIDTTTGADTSSYPNALCMSAKTGLGVAELAASVAAVLKGSADTGGSLQAGLGTARQKKAADSALGALRAARDAAADGFPLDAVASDLDDALDALGEITGAVHSDDILASVFSRFCVGK
jgi:tRNA modification GTPase